MAKLTSKKAKEILHDKEVRNKPLTDKQRRFFGAIASGKSILKKHAIGDTIDNPWKETIPYQAYLPQYQVPINLNNLESTTTLKNIHTGKPVITPYQEYINKPNQSELAELIKDKQEYINQHSDVYTDPKTGKQVIQNIGIKPSASPIDAAALGVGALYSGGATLLGSMAELANPIPLPSYKNLYKLNPLAFKPNPEAYYRMIGKEGYKDAAKTGVLRPKQEQWISELSQAEKDQMKFYGDEVFGNSLYDKPYFLKGDIPKEYKGNIVAEVNGIEMDAGKKSYGVYQPKSINNIPVDKVKFYKEHWLKGYKEIPRPVTPFSRNIKDLKYAENWANTYGYKLPQNLERIAESNLLTDRTIKGLVNRHNTFVRGVSTNWSEIERLHPEILRHLEDKGIDYVNNPAKAAEYMATHVPINTGYGRASLTSHVFDAGKNAIYTSNSMGTAEGYTYGKGFIVKVKRPTDFSSPNRLDWINKNQPAYFENSIPTITTKRRGFLPKTKLDDSKNILKTEHASGKEDQVSAYYNTLNKFIESKKANGVNIEADLSKLAMNDPEMKKLSLGMFNLEKEISASPTILDKNGYIIDNTLDLRNNLKQLENAKFNRYKDITKSYLLEHHPDFTDTDRYAHYIHIGTPGEKLLEPIKSWEITPEIWKNKSRAHTNIYSNKLSAASTLPTMIIGAKQLVQSNDKLVKKQTGGKLYTPEADKTAMVPSISPDVTNKWLSALNGSEFNYNDYLNKASQYLARPVFSGSILTARDIADSARDFYKKTGFVMPLNFLLTQGQQETSLGTKLKSKNNIFNVGNTTEGKTRDFASPRASVDNYIDLIYNDYLQKGEKPLKSLLEKNSFVNYAGKRYAHDAQYESKVASQMKFVDDFLKKQNKGIIPNTAYKK